VGRLGPTQFAYAIAAHFICDGFYDNWRKTQMEKIGFVGLGIMGKPMSKNLIKAGHKLVVYDIISRPLEELATAGAEIAASPSGVASQANIIITMLPNSPHVKQAILGEKGVLEGARPGALVVDMSSIAPLVAKEVGGELAKKGIRMLDAPVSGGEPKAIEGTLSIMVGGAQADFDQMLPIFKAMGSSAVLTGALGAGNVTKLANQIIVALNIAAVSEALVLATKSGVDPNLVYQAIRGGLAGSTVLDAKAPLMMDRKFNPGFRINLHIKDLGNALETSHEIGVPLPLSAAVMEIMQALKVDGMGECDHGSIVRFYEKLAQIEVKR
jgi:2-hydroxy-3-oxopropionate reductase